MVRFRTAAIPILATVLAAGGTFIPSIRQVAAGPFISPVSSVTHWSPNIPNSGPISSIAVQPANDQHVFVASAYGGLFESQNRGTDWRHRDDLPSWQARDVKWDGSQPYAVATTGEEFEAQGRGGGGVYTTTGPAGAWEANTNIFSGTSARCSQYPGAWGISVAPKTNDVYVATDCGIAVGRFNSGTARFDWTHHDIPGASDASMNSVLALGGGRVIAGGPGTFWSDDGGTSWTASTGTMAGGSAAGLYVEGVHAFAADPRGHGRAYMVDVHTHLFQTQDYGHTWTEMPAPAADGSSCGGIANVETSVESNVVKLYYGNKCSNFVSTLGADGTIWSPWVSINDSHDDTRDMAFAPATGAPYLLSSDGGIERAVDDTDFHWVGGPAHGLDANVVVQVTGQYVPHQLDPDLYWGTWHNFLWSTRDASPAVNPYIPSEGGLFGVPRTTTDPYKERITFTDNFGWGQSGRFYSHPAGWKGPDGAGGSTTLIGSNQYVQTTGIGSSSGLAYASGPSAGEPTGTWTRIASIPRTLLGQPSVSTSGGTQTLTQPFGSDGGAAIARVSRFAGGSPGTVAYPAMTESIGGALAVHPVRIGEIPINLPLEVLAVDPRDPNRMIAPDVANRALSVSVDGGVNWVAPDGAADEITNYGSQLFETTSSFAVAPPRPDITTISICPDNDNRVLLDTHNGGAFWSYDGGETWAAVQNSRQVNYGTSIFWASGCGSAYMSTWGRGIWRIGMGLQAQVLNGKCWATPICNVQHVLDEYQFPHLPGIVVSDGFIKSIARKKHNVVVHVTSGSVLTYYRKAPAGVKVVRDSGVRPAKKRYTFAAFFSHGKLVRKLRSPKPLQFYPITHRDSGKMSGVPPSQAASITIGAKATIDGGYPVVDMGDPVKINAVFTKPATEEVYLSIDGQTVAKGSAGSKDLNYLEPSQEWGEGVHDVGLVAGTGKAAHVLSTTEFLVPNGD